MIALRGKLERDNNNKDGSWKWAGEWAFGSELRPAATAASKSAARTVSSTRLPFSYVFDRIVSPDQIALPSAEEIKEDGEAAATDDDDVMKASAEDDSSPQQQPSQGGGNETQKETNTETFEEKAPNLDTALECAEKDPKKETTSAEEPATSEKEKTGSVDAVVEKQAKDPETKTVESEDKQETEAEKTGPIDRIHEPTTGESSNAVASADRVVGDTNQQTSANKPGGSKKVTFADKTSPDDPDFTDAFTIHAEKCSPSGAWKGYFETPVNRKTPKTLIRIEESFFLFLNATPPADARSCFPDDSTPASAGTEAFDSNKNTVVGMLQPGQIHARGMGQNQYGTFELVGCLDLNTGILSCQRIYVQILESSASSSSSTRQQHGVTPRGRSRRRASWDSAAALSSESRPSRNRQMSWKRRAADEIDHMTSSASATTTAAVTGTGTDTAATTTGTASAPQPLPLQRRRTTGSLNSGPRKRARIVADSSVMAVPTAAVTAAATASVPLAPATMPTVASIAVSTIPPGMQLPTPVVVDQPHSTTAAASAAAMAMPPPPPPPLQKRQSIATPHSHHRGSGTHGSSSSSSSVGTLKLPAAGDPAKARWRAAHFLYYHRPEPPDAAAGAAAEDNNSIATANSSSSQQQQPKYVVYQGEMMDSKREGRGISLYSNGTLYEGEWRRDKEHGYGTLMSSDRQRIIYKGEFEKGRIQGVGVYYYYSHLNHSSSAAALSSNANSGRKTGSGGKQSKAAASSTAPTVGGTESRYEGEFKENLRHGTGIYYLPDGSVYNGSFRENLFSGRGVFTWPDGSVYDGEWKDGRRNGLGVLKASDGFTYDGMWIDNSMEGRGSATYPKGQTYNGLFSQGRREGRGTILFTNGAVYEGRFRNDAIDGQGTMKMGRTMVVPHDDRTSDASDGEDDENSKEDFMIPVSFQSDMGHIHRKAGFTGLGK